MIKFYKIWLICLGISLIFLDKYTVISYIRDNISAFIGSKVSLYSYRIKSYTPLLLMNVDQQQDLAKQNATLKKQVEEYSLLLQQSKNANQNIKNLQEISDYRLQSNFKQIIAKPVLDINYFVGDKLLIEFNKGESVSVGSAVVNKDGIVGQILSVNNSTAQVYLITNPNVKIYLQNTVDKSKVLAQGAGNNSLVVRYIDKQNSLKVGDILETTGLDDVYPGGLKVARVTKVFTENNGFDSAVCVPVIDFSQLQYVSVLENDNR